METFGKFIAFMIAIVLNTLIVGYTFSLLWGWFIVTTFNTRPLSIVESLGVITIWSYIKLKREEEKDEDFAEAIIKGVLFTFIMSIWVIVVGYVLTLFM